MYNMAKNENANDNALSTMTSSHVSNPSSLFADELDKVVSCVEARNWKDMFRFFECCVPFSIIESILIEKLNKAAIKSET